MRTKTQKAGTGTFATMCAGARKRSAGVARKAATIHGRRITRKTPTANGRTPAREMPQVVCVEEKQQDDADGEDDAGESYREKAESAGRPKAGGRLPGVHAQRAPEEIDGQREPQCQQDDGEKQMTEEKDAAGGDEDESGVKPRDRREKQARS